MEKAASVVDGWIANGGTRDMRVTRGLIGWKYFERPQAINAA